MCKSIALSFVVFLFCFLSFSQCNFPTAAFVDDSTLYICPPNSNTPGSLTLSFDASASTSAAGTSISRYEWYWGDGTFSFTTTPTTDHTFPGIGVYEVLLRVRDTNTSVDPDGCISNNDEVKIISVTPEPSFSGSSPNTIDVDCGETVDLTGVVSSQTSVQGVFVFGSQVSLPDGNGVSYESSVNLTGLFAPGSTVDAMCYPIVTLNLEHSYSGDLNIDLIAPTGESVRLFNQIGADTNFGTCTNPADNSVFGCSASYTIVNTGGVSWNSGGSTTTTTSNCSEYTGSCEGGSYFVPQTYNSVNSFAAFDGANLNGEWTLRITDELAQDDGHINGWSLEFPQSCFDDLLSVTPNIVSATWSHTGSGPSIPAQTPIDSSVVDPGPDDCPETGTCLGIEINNSLTIGPFNSLGGPFTYTLTAIDEFGCEFTYDVNINVNVAGNPTFDPIAPICIGQSTNPLPNISNNGITGSWAPPFDNTTTTTYTFTPDLGQCIPVTSTVDITVTVLPEPVGTNTTEVTCSDNALNHDLNADVDLPSTFIWIASDNPDVTGETLTAANTDVITDTLTNTSGVDQIVVYTITPTDNVNNCEGDPFTLTVTVHPKPVGSNTTEIICSDDTLNYNLNADVNLLSTFSWVATDNPDVIGETLTAVTTDIITDTLTNTSGIAQDVIYVITPTDSTNNCVGDPFTLTVTVQPEPFLSTNLDAPVCSNEPIGIILDVVVGSAAASTYNIINIENNGLVASAGSPIEANGLPANEIEDDAYTNTTNAPVLVTYTIVPVSANGCQGDAENVNITINPLPVISFNEDLIQCDDDTDGFADFNLTEANSLISNNADNETFTYHQSLTDANTGNNPITNPIAYQNTDPSSNPDVIFVRVVNPDTGCFSIAELRLFVAATQIPNTVEILYEVCDEDTNITDGITSFDFSDAETQIRAESGLPTGQNLFFSYYETEDDSEAETNAIQDITNHININSPFEQEIYVRIDSEIDNACVGLGVHVRLRVVNPMPNTDPNPIVVCDDDPAEFLIEVIDVTEEEAYILNGDSALVATYHTTFTGAFSQDNSIPNPTSYTNTLPSETIFVRVTNINSNCFAIVEQEILVNPLPDDTAVIPNLSECEINTDFFFDFNLENLIPDILNGQDPTQFKVTFHTTQQGADDLDTSQISDPSMFTNTVIGSQTIFVAITNTLTGCSVSTQSFIIEVNEGAEAINDFYEICDVNGPNDGIAQFDLQLRIPIILNGQNAADFPVDFYDNLTDAENNNTANRLPLLYENRTNPQIIFVRVSNAIRPDECFDIAEVTLQVNLLPIFDLEAEYILCLTSNNDAVVDIPPILDTQLSDTEYSFEWRLDGNILATEQAPYLDPTPYGQGEYSVLVTNNLTGCSSTDVALVTESELPIFPPPQVTTEAFTGNNTIVAQATGMSTYEYSLDNGPWQLDGEFNNVSGGLHTVFVRDVLGCGMISQEVLVLDYPKFFTPNGDGQNDTWTITGIDTQPTATIYIFDRYGKLLKQLSPTSPGWDGTFNGNRMPTDDYWFRLEYVEPLTDEARTFSAHFTLKR